MKTTSSSQPECPFCLSNNLFKGDILAESADAFLTENHTKADHFLIIPKAHIESPLDLPDTWWSDMEELMAKIPQISGHYNISLNIGQHAGQTVKHLHFWIIPRAPGLPSSGKGLATLIAE
jgi:diadenosine tetraphosphate (Ap4A) HIT family hydrolase